MRKFIFIFVTLFSLVSCGSAPKKDDYTIYENTFKKSFIYNTELYVNLEPNKQVVFRGSYDSNNQIGYGSQLYHGGAGVAGFLAQIFTHSAINSGGRNSKLSESQKVADQVLLPFESVLKDFYQKELFSEISQYSFNVKKNGTNQINIISKPIFFLSQNKKQIILKHLVEAKLKNNKNFSYRNLVEYISDEYNQADIDNYFTANKGRHLKKQVKEMYLNSLEFIINDIKGAYKSSPKEKSYRFKEGSNLRIERAKLVEEGQERALVRNLRGWLISFPKSDNI